MSILNFNVGILGHVDSGKTSLAKALSSIGSTASFDKNPQSRERGKVSEVQALFPIQFSLKS